MTPLRAVSIASVALLAYAGAPAGAQRLDDIGLHGYVLAPDGLPVSAGSVTMQSGTTRATAAIESNGRFRIEASTSGQYQLSVSAPDLTPHRVTVTVPPSRTLRLPVIRLTAPTYFRVRLVTAGGDPIAPQWLRRQSLDPFGVAVQEAPEHRVADAIDAERNVVVGPLQRGITTMYVDAPGLARTRLPDLHVTGDEPVLEGGTVVVTAGTVLHVDVVDGNNAPVPEHGVIVEDVRPLSPIAIPGRTNAQGRATFDRLAAGQYRLRSQSVGRCGPVYLWVAPVVSISGSGTAERRLVVGGTARLRIRSPHGDMPNTSVFVSPEGGAPPLSPMMKAMMDKQLLAKRPDPGCNGVTDAEGRVAFAQFPPGPAVVHVRVPNATHVRRVNVPEGGREIVLQVPQGLLPVRVTSAATNRPLSLATVTWSGGGARVEGTTTGTGDALLESVATTGGTLAVTADGHERAELAFDELPASVVEVVLERTPPTSLHARVVTSAGAPIADAVVELSPRSGADAGYIAVTDKSGGVVFADAPGARRLTAAASGFAIRTLQVPERDRTELVVPLTPGYRAALTVELPASWGRQAVRVLTDRGVPIDELLDSASDRIVDPPGALSLGPLMPGNYTIEFHGMRGRHAIAISIVDGNVAATIRGAEGANQRLRQ